MPIIPKNYLCKITHQIMFDPVVAEDGYTYERAAIEEWLINNHTSPMTKEIIGNRLTPNKDTNVTIIEFLDDNVRFIYEAIETSTLKHDNLEFINALIKRNNANLDRQDEAGQTPLHIAVINRKTNIIQLLLQAGADHKIRNNRHQTPKKIAKEFGYWDLVEIIEQEIKSIDQMKFTAISQRLLVLQKENLELKLELQRIIDEQTTKLNCGIPKQSPSLLNTESKPLHNHNEVFSDLTQQEQISPRTQKMFGSIRVRNVEKFEAIVANTSDINCCNIGKKGDTVLMAILRNHRLKKRLRDGDEIEISKIQILIKYGASWITKNKLGETAEDLLKSYDSNIIARIKGSLLEGTQSSSVDLPASIESKATFKSDFPLSLSPLDDFTPLSSTVMLSSKAQKICNISVMEKANIDSLTLFLNHISFGKQDQAEDMLCQNHDLVLMSGDLTDCANRQFTQITALQYAAWALDWSMLEMLKKYLSKEAMRKQITELERGTWIQGYSSVVSWQKLIDALQRYIDNYNIWTDLECRVHWIQNVGGEQLMLPAHVIQEYCRSDKTQKSAEPVLLSRIDISINKNWFENNKGEKLGRDFGRIRGYIGKKDGKCRSIPVKDIRFNEHWINMIKHDIKLLERLLKIRLQQCTNFIFNPPIVETPHNMLKTQKLKSGLELYLLEQMKGNTFQKTPLMCSVSNSRESQPILPIDEQSLIPEFTTKCRLVF